MMEVDKISYKLKENCLYNETDLLNKLWEQQKKECSDKIGRGATFRVISVIMEDGELKPKLRAILSSTPFEATAPFYSGRGICDENNLFIGWDLNHKKKKKLF